MNMGIESNYGLWIFVLAGILFIVVFISWIYSTKIDKFKNDFYRLSSLTSACVYILNISAYLVFLYYTTYKFDFVGTILLQSLLVIAAVFIFFPVCITLYQLYVQLKKWEKQSVDLGEWISTNASFLYFMSIVTLSPFTAIKLCRSHLFNLSQFSMPLTRLQSSKFQSQRLYTIILLQVECLSMTFHYVFCICLCF